MAVLYADVAAGTQLPQAEAQAHYTTLKRLVTAHGLFHRRPLFYLLNFLAVFVPFVGGILVLQQGVTSTYAVVGLAVFLAFLSGQFSYIGHDLGHRQVFNSVRLNELTMLVITVLVGIGPTWWRLTHNEHHAYPNDDLKDPNMTAPLLAFDEETLVRLPRPIKAVVRFQPYYLVVLLALESVAMKINSVRTALTKPLELSALAAHFVLYVYLLRHLSLESAVLFAVVHHLVIGTYLGAVFITNHVGLPSVGADSFLINQLATSRNVRAGVVPDWFFGGLHHQVEHHLFPNMPRRNLSKARVIVGEYCRAHGLPYYETTIGDAYASVMRHMATVARASAGA